MERMEDSPSYRLGVAIEVVRGLLYFERDWMRRRAEEWLKGEDERTEKEKATTCY